MKFLGRGDRNFCDSSGVIILGGEIFKILGELGLWRGEPGKFKG